MRKPSLLGRRSNRPARFDYRRDTERYYFDSEVVRRYHTSMQRGILSRSGLLARRERTVVKELLKMVPHRSVLDIPTGTGKMAPVLVELGSTVVACDISTAMLSVARRTYEELGLRTVSFERVDLLTASRSLEKEFDVVLCIRLLHRVSQEVRSSMLSEIAKLGGFGIISVGIRNRYHEVRRVIRRRLLGGEDIGNEQRQTRAETDRLVLRTHRILARRAVFRGLSGEWVYLLERR